MTQRIVVVGGGFAGVWSALSAARAVEGRGSSGEIEITLVSLDPYLTIRPRLYESDLDGVRVPLDAVLGPVGVRRVQGRVLDIDAAARTVSALVAGSPVSLAFDRLVLAAGSQVRRPALPGLAENAFSVDTYADARRLDQHLRSLPRRADVPARYRAIVIGAGFTGIEVATGLALRLRRVAGPTGHRHPVRVSLVDRGPVVGGDVGAEARPVIEDALRTLGVEVRLGAAAVDITASGVTLADGERLLGATTVWTGGFAASALTGCVGVPTDDLGRLPVDATLRVAGAGQIFAAGDVAHALADAGRPTLMSCQHAIPMGKFAGHNAASDLMGSELMAYRQPDYVTCLDLGEAGALFTRGWDRAVLFTGSTAKRLKRQINRHDIYPPMSGSRDELLRATRPETPSMDGLVALGERWARRTAVAHF